MEVSVKAQLQDGRWALVCVCVCICVCVWEHGKHKKRLWLAVMPCLLLASAADMSWPEHSLPGIPILASFRCLLAAIYDLMAGQPCYIATFVAFCKIELCAIVVSSDGGQRQAEVHH